MAAKRSPGRPEKKVDLVKLKKCAALGMNVIDCALAQGMAKETFMQKKTKDPAIQAAWEEGRALGIEKMTKLLMDRASKDKSDAAIIFYLKARAGWSDRQQVVIEGGDKPVQIEVSDVRSKVMSALLPPDETED